MKYKGVSIGKAIQEGPKVNFIAPLLLEQKKRSDIIQQLIVLQFG
jgi:hypothetical protein